MPEFLVCSINGNYRTDVDPEQVRQLRAQPETTIWLDVYDPDDNDFAMLSEQFQAHPLAIEDIRNGRQRAKVEVYDQQYFIIFYAIRAGEGMKHFHAQPVYVFAGNNYLVTVHQGEMQQVAETMRRWRDPHSPPSDRIGSLLYNLLDTIVDDYFPLLDAVADQAEQIEDQIFEHFEQSSIQMIFELKRELLALRRLVAPERDVLNILMRRELSLFRSKDIAYLQDVYDHVIRITDSIDNYRDLLSSALDSYLSVEASRQNKILKVLTVTSIVLMSDALIAGIYGMNFINMPELVWRYGYMFALGLMVVVSTVLIVFFRRLRWI